MTALLEENQADAHEAVNRMVGNLVIAMSDANLTLSDLQAQYGGLIFTGTLTANRDVIFPEEAKQWIIENATTGGFSLVLKKSGGTGYTLATATTARVWYNSNDADIALAE